MPEQEHNLNTSSKTAIKNEPAAVKTTEAQSIESKNKIKKVTPKSKNKPLPYTKKANAFILKKQMAALPNCVFG